MCFVEPTVATRRRHSRRRRPHARYHEVRASLPAGDRGDAPECLGSGASARARRPPGGAISTRLPTNRGTFLPTRRALGSSPASSSTLEAAATRVSFERARGSRVSWRRRVGSPLSRSARSAFTRLQTPLLLFAAHSPDAPTLPLDAVPLLQDAKKMSEEHPRSVR